MNKKIAIFTLLVTATLPMASVMAEEGSTASSPTLISKPQPTVSRQENKEIRLQNRTEAQQNTLERCKNVEQRVAAKITKLEENKQLFGLVFKNMEQRLTRLSTRLSSSGIDTTKLQADIKILNEKIAKLNTDNEAFIAGLKTAQVDAPTACGTSKGKFMNQLVSTRALSQATEKNRLDIKNFFQTTIKPDIMAIRKQIETKNEEKISSNSASPAPKTGKINTPNPTLTNQEVPPIAQ